MLQIFSRSVRSANPIMGIGFVTQNEDVGRQLKEYVAQREGVDLSLIASGKVVPGYDPRGISIFVYDLDSSGEASQREFQRFMARFKEQADTLAESILHDEMPHEEREALRHKRLGILEVLRSPNEDRQAQVSVLAQYGIKPGTVQDDLGD